MSAPPTRLYGELADWFHLLTAPEEYAEEAEFYLRRFTEAIGAPPRTLLELGSGGGNMASHYKSSVAATLTDVSPAMLSISKQINPECEHVVGDMRNIRLGREFDAVLVHDAVCYITLDDLHRAMATAFVHCRPSGAAIFAPDDLRETFRAQTNHGGNDGPDRSMRYIEWTTDPDPSDMTYIIDYACMLREREKPLRVERDRHVCGLFSEAQWLGGLEAAGFDPVTQMQGPAEPTHDYRVFIAVRPRTAVDRSWR